MALWIISKVLADCERMLDNYDLFCLHGISRAQCIKCSQRHVSSIEKIKLQTRPLLCYEPLAVLCKPLWQELHHMMHIHAAPPFLMIKTVVQVIFIVMNKTVKRVDSTIHGAFFAVLMAAYIGFIFRHKPYNYPRLFWWQALSLISVDWLSIISTISSNAEGNSYIYFSIVWMGWIIIALVGFYVQRKKYPSLLYRKKGLDTTHSFKFTFTLWWAL